ncbi:AAA family ATPase [Nonomuraea sp. MTCD27]|uniref:AAA family ATPase n=1 Tax=Nonomuraea sp. MTCD27 TaxID=1676747 RepID=UPI0035C15382
MRFWTVESRTSLPATLETAFLIRDRWDDYRFKTQYFLSYRDADGALHAIGNVKIGRFGIGEEGWVSPPDSFTNLASDFFSLGQDDSYYENLNKLGSEIRLAVLGALNDMALNLELFRRARHETVTGKSLLRFVSVSTVLNQFHRMALGGARLSQFSFRYIYPQDREEQVDEPLSLSFEVEPESQPPTNVHVVIGPNGAGKSHLLNNIALILVSQGTDTAAGKIESGLSNGPPENLFANVVSVAFSAFDEFRPVSNSQDRSRGILYRYIGLKRVARSSTAKANSLKDASALAQEFGTSVTACLQQARMARWRRALEMLQSDPIFADAQIAGLADSDAGDEEIKADARDLFRVLSSGHKIVLLTITRLVETLEERSLVLVDEPESHLHPPLLSAFIRALSDLLIDRNGAAIIATHSPVVLQEVPRKCVWKLRRYGNEVYADRPEIETFGENVGVLTQEAFGLEVTKSGFHRMLAEGIRPGSSYAEIVQEFQGSLGSEARALLQSLLLTRGDRERF